MTRRQLLETEWAKRFLKAGLISASAYAHLNRIMIYEKCREQEHGHIESCDLVAKLTKCARTNVRRSVIYMEDPTEF